MWLKKKNDIICISINQSAVTCALIKQGSSRAGSQLELHAFKAFELHNFITDTSICNPTALQKIITTFATTYNLKHAFATIAVGHTSIHEFLVNLPTANPNARDFSHLKLGKLAWDYRYLYPADNGNFVFYIAGVRHELLLQYTLMIQKIPLQFVTLTTSLHALITLYQACQASAFRQLKLEQDMQSCNYQLATLFSADMLYRLMSFKTNFDAAHLPHLLVCTGLYLNERNL